MIADPGPDLMFDDRLYKRGALTLHALRLTLGDETFFDWLRDWVAEHRFGTVTTALLTDEVSRSGRRHRAAAAVALAARAAGPPDSAGAAGLDA